MNIIQKYPQLLSYLLVLENVTFYLSITSEFFNFFRNMFNTKTIKINNFIFFLQNKATQCVAVSLCSSRFITYAPSFIFLGKLSLEKTPLNLDLFS